MGVVHQVNLKVILSVWESVGFLPSKLHVKRMHFVDVQWCLLMQTGGLFTGFTRLSKGLAAVLVAGFLANAVTPYTTLYASLIPGKYVLKLS